MSTFRREARAEALGRALRRAAERECERHAPGLRDAVLAEIRAPVVVRARRGTAWRLAAGVAALLTLSALAVVAWRAAQGEPGASTACGDAGSRATGASIAGRAARGAGRDSELAAPRALSHAASVPAGAHGFAPGLAGLAGVPRASAGTRGLLARTLPESRALDTALRGEIAGLGRDALAVARFVLERARLGPPARGS